MPRKTETEVSLDEFVPDEKVETTIAPPETLDLKYTPAPEYDDRLMRDWWEFVRNVPQDAPYDLLNQLPFHRGFVYKIEQDRIEVLDQSVLVTFVIRIGRHMDELRYLDQFSIQVPRNTVAPTMAARSIMAPSAIYTVFGRLPPEQPPVPASQQAPAAPQPAPQPAPEAPQPAPQPAPAAPVVDAPWMQNDPQVEYDLVEERTPDGLPVFTNLYTVEGDPHDIALQALVTLEDALDLATSQAALTALWNKNVAAIEFIKDFGEDDGKAKLAALAEQFKKKAARFRR